MSEQVMQDALLGRQPILDKHGRLVAYELLFRDSARDTYASFIDGNQATAIVLSTLFADLSLNDVLGPYKGLVKVDRALLFSDILQAVPPDVAMVEPAEVYLLADDWHDHATALGQKGYRLVLRYSPDLGIAQYKSLATYLAAIRISFGQVPLADLAATVANFHAMGVQVLADRIEQPDQAQACKSAGVDLYEGFFFARPSIVRGRRLLSTETSLLKLISLLSQDADTAVIEAAFKTDPARMLSLLQLSNSVGTGSSRKITSIRQAITMIGRKQLQRWLLLLLYSGLLDDGPQSPLLQAAATRGHLMELLMEHAHSLTLADSEAVDQAYLTGMFSLMPSMLRMELPELLKNLPLPGTVTAALVKRDGILGDLLCLCEAADALDWPRFQHYLSKLPGLSVQAANHCLAVALNWANQIMPPTQKYG